MASSLLPGAKPPATTDPRLDSWKQIAAYLGKSERTVRRWQQTEGMPVHRHIHQQRGSVWAYRHELDEWLERRKLGPAPLAEELPAPVSRARFPVVGAALVVSLLMVPLILFRTGQPRPSRLTPVPLTTLRGEEREPAFSPDGRQIAFFWGPPDGLPGIYLKTLGSESLTPLAVSAETTNSSPAWSPDGKSIALLSRSGEETWLHVVPSSGGPQRRIISLAKPGRLIATNVHLGWSADGAWIIAPKRESAGLHGIFRISAATGEIQRVTDPGKFVDWAPAIDPGGNTVAFVRRSSSVLDPLQDIMLIDVGRDGTPRGNARSIYKGRFIATGLAWSPTGKDLILCRRDIEESSALWRLPAHPGAIPQMLGGEDCTTVAVSRADATGNAMMVFGKTTNSTATLWRASLKALDSPSAIARSTRLDVQPSISPDGRSIAFLSNRSGSLEIWIVNPDGTGLRRLTENTNIRSKPAWSPDGRTIAYSRDRQLFMLPASGGVAQPISTGAQKAAVPSWSRDGRAIYFETEGATWRIALDTGLRQPVPAPEPSALAESPDGKMLFFMRAAGGFRLCKWPVNGGSEEVVLKDLTTPNLAMSNRYVYCIRSDGKLVRVPIHGGPPEVLGWLRESSAAPPQYVDSGLTVSPDDSSIVYSASGDRDIDLMLVRNFR